ncbi:MAG TPA: glycosyltransferase [Gemmataceae bacterium]|nr:glycosyltransferase [Gemmataceae bacterium]
MARKYLFGPVSQRFVERNLLEHCASGDCLPFDSAGQLGFTITDGDDWEAVLKRLPGGWRPDFVVLDLHYTTIPHCLWQAPVPLVGLAADWNWLWHAYRRLLGHVDLILTDTEGVERLAKEGIHHALAANLFGLEAGWLSAVPALDANRDIDVLFAGNMHQAVQRERLRWLGRLVSLGDRYCVSIVQGVFDTSYRDLARRARIIFNRSIWGECNMRAFEAAAAGALLFQEESNREIAAYFRDRQECVLYNDQNLEQLLLHYLEHEDERRGIAEAACKRVEEFTFAKLWCGHLNRIEQEWVVLQARARERCVAGEAIDWRGRLWQALGSGQPRSDSGLVQDLVSCCASGSGDRLESLSYVRADLHNGLGMALALTNTGGELQPIGEEFARAVRLDRTHPVAGLNLVEALIKGGQRTAAIEEAKATLSILNRDDNSELETQPSAVAAKYHTTVHNQQSTTSDSPFSPPLGKGGAGGVFST